jgi:GNAT superfamily N-acetyltransferase
MSYVIEPELFEPAVPELEPTLFEHWEELAENKDIVPLDPDYERYYMLESINSLLFVTIRKNGELIGYFIGIINKGLHYQTTIDCRMDIFYVRKQERGGSLGIKLFKAVEKELRARGVDRWYVGCKVKHDVGKLFERLGFNAIETFYSKVLI